MNKLRKKILLIVSEFKKIDALKKNYICYNRSYHLAVPNKSNTLVAFD